MANTIITIGRQFGSGGHEIGKLAAQKLGIECYDSRLIQLASEKSCIGMEHLKPVDEKRANPWLYTVPSDYSNEMTGFGLPMNDMLFNVQSQIIQIPCWTAIRTSYPFLSGPIILSALKGSWSARTFQQKKRKRSSKRWIRTEAFTTISSLTKNGDAPKAMISSSTAPRLAVKDVLTSSVPL